MWVEMLTVMVDWIGLDWISNLVDWVGLDFEKWTHGHLCCRVHTTNSKSESRRKFKFNENMIAGHE